MQIGLKLWSTNIDYYYNEAQKLYNRGCFDYIELYVLPNTTSSLNLWKKLNIPFILHAPHSAHGFNLADKTKRSSNQEVYEQVQIFSKILNASYVIFHGGLDGSAEELIFQLNGLQCSNALIENKPLIPLANHKFKICRGATIEEITLIMQNCSCGFCLDFVHALCSANSQKINPYTYILKFLELKPTMFHISNISSIKSEKDEHLLLQNGELDIQYLCNLIPQKTFLTIETTKSNKFNLNDFFNDITYIKNIKGKI